MFAWLDHRAAGVLLHPTAFPGDQGVGTLGAEADRFLDFLAAAGFHYWQICPLGPTGFGNSPYQCFSAFAGNPYLIDLRPLAQSGLVPPSALESLRSLPADRVDFGALWRLKWSILFGAHESFRRQRGLPLPYGDFADFCDREADWLDDYAYFLALKDHFQGRPWWEWPEDLRRHDSALRSPLRTRLAGRAETHRFLQYLFFGQWRRLHERARERGVAVIGDIPIFVALDSADVWAHPELFQLDPSTRRPRVVAGVPPDYFSADGQLWGNPLFDWPAHRAAGYAWWRRRLEANFAIADVLRIDHFRGFESYWAIPAGAPTARTGRWEPGPGLDFFAFIRREFPQARIIAEDLGILTPEVRALRDATGLPGMAILQFAFDGRDAANLYLPHNLVANSVVYPGTHDNATSRGWYESAPEAVRDQVRRYFRISGQEIGWDFIRAAYASVSRLAVIPLQDLMSLGAEARFNTPGRPDGNWEWRYRPEQLDRLERESAAYLREIGLLYGRIQPPAAAAR